MEITESLKQDLQSAPDWFHKSIAILPRKENFIHAAGNLKYQVWDRANAKNIVVLIHGTGAHKKWWDPIAPLINEDFTVIAPDLPGMGESDHRNAYNFEEFSEALIAIINQEKIVSNYQKIYLVGHSLGGHVAGFMASEFPDLFHGVIMIDSPIRPPTYDYDKHQSTGPLRRIKYYPDKVSIIKRFRLMPPQDCENGWYLRYIAEHSVFDVEEGWRWRFDDKLFATLRRLNNYEFKFQCPALFVAGGKSLLLESKIMKYIREAFKDSMAVEVIEDAAHHVPLDSPLELISLINNYLRQWEEKNEKNNNNYFRALTLSLVAFLWLGNKNSIEPLDGCKDNEELKVYCNFMNPEDLALTPDGNFLIVAEFGGMAPLAEMTSGKLSFFNIKDKTRSQAKITFGENEWGSVDCSRDPSIPFGPHGIDLVQREDGKQQLAVVSHHPNESIEMFELLEKDGWVLEWKGCVDVDGKYYFNDVSLDMSGNFYASHMFESDFSMISALWNVFAKSDTGMVVKWTQDNKFEELNYTAGSFPNGIALDQKNNNLIVNYNLGDKSILFDLNSKQSLGIYEHNSPDNVVIKGGFAWVTNHDHSVAESLGCAETVNCTLPFSVNKLSLSDLSLVESYKFKSKNMGVGTVGLPHDGSLWIGSYHSDRLAEASLSFSE